MTTTDLPRTRRVRVTHEPVPGAPSWRAVIAESGTAHLEPQNVPVGRFDTQHEAITTACTALRFLAAGIPWRGQS